MVGVRRGVAMCYSSGVMELRIVRHAESTGNSSGRWQGRYDTQLTELGREQAARLRVRFEAEGYQPTHIYSSPLSRTLHTARIACGGWKLPIETWDDLMENDVGVFSGLTWEEVEARHPETAREFARNRDMDVVEGAETNSERADRARRVVDRLIAGHSNDDRPLVFSHGGFIGYLFAELMGASRLWGLGVRNTAMFDFSIDVERWRLDGQHLSNSALWRIERFNDAGHLDEGSEIDNPQLFIDRFDSAARDAGQAE